jgi:hypothetical protein
MSLALAAKPFGIDLINQKFPVAATIKMELRPWEPWNLLGMNMGAYGLLKGNWVSIKKMWGGIIASAIIPALCSAWATGRSPVNLPAEHGKKTAAARIHRPSFRLAVIILVPK